jgi:hypothetical protein
MLFETVLDTLGLRKQFATIRLQLGSQELGRTVNPYIVVDVILNLHIHS